MNPSRETGKKGRRVHFGTQSTVVRLALTEVSKRN